MNERLKELAEQAKLNVDKLPDDVYIPLEKFAELIVKECVGIIDNRGKFLRYNTLANKIREHFGIEK